MKTQAVGIAQPLHSLLLILGLAVGLVACSSPRHGTGDSHSSTGHAKLQLNNGKKWVVDAPMMVHLRTVEKEVRDFEASSNRDHPRLATNIQETLGRLVTNCTMEGKAHDELHKWLLPFLGLTAEYYQATETPVQQQKFGEIKQALLAFNTYFE